MYSNSCACAVENPSDDSLLITGGYDSKQGIKGPATGRATKYDLGINIEDLPEMNIARADHACGYYMDYTPEVAILTYLVVGGFDSSGKRISSTEILVYNPSKNKPMKWETVSPLPTPLSGLRAVSYQYYKLNKINTENTIFVFGKSSIDFFILHLFHHRRRG